MLNEREQSTYYVDYAASQIGALTSDFPTMFDNMETQLDAIIELENEYGQYL